MFAVSEQKEHMRICGLVLLFASSVFAQNPSISETDTPTVLTFVAPAYPRAAKEQRMQGRALTAITGQTILRIGSGPQNQARKKPEIVENPYSGARLLAALVQQDR